MISKKKIFNWLPIVLLILLMAVSGFIIYAAPFKELLNQSHHIKNGLAETGNAASIIFLLGAAFLTGIGVPRLILCSLAGAVFDFKLGILLSHLATIMGAYLSFVVARWLSRASIQKRFPKIISLTQYSQISDWYSVFLMRQLPISGLYNSILLGLSTVNHLNFLIGTFIGFLPLGVTATLVGAGAIQADLATIARYLAIAAFTFYLLPLFLKYMLAQWRIKNP